MFQATKYLQSKTAVVERNGMALTHGELKAEKGVEEPFKGTYWSCMDGWLGLPLLLQLNKQPAKHQKHYHLTILVWCFQVWILLLCVCVCAPSKKAKLKELCVALWWCERISIKVLFLIILTCSFSFAERGTSSFFHSHSFHLSLFSISLSLCSCEFVCVPLFHSLQKNLYF